MRQRSHRGVLRAVSILLPAVVLLAASAAVSAADGGGAVSGMYGTAWALAPPAVAIVLAFLIKEPYSSLFAGIVVGALFLCDFAPVAALDAIIGEGFVAAVADNAGIFLFLALLGAIVVMVSEAGGTAAFGRWAQRHIKSRCGAMLATFALGLLIFVDDYFNCLTVGSVMLPITERNKVSRAKLSYLIDATAAPVCMIAPVSSWAAAVSGVAADLDTGISGIELFVRAIPYNFYSILTFVFAVGISVMDFDFGSMQVCEKEARARAAAADEAEEKEGEEKRIGNLVWPVVFLIVLCVVSMIYVGGFFGADLSGDRSCAGDFIGAFGNTDAYVALPWGSLITLVFTVVFLTARRAVTFKDAMACIPKGFHAMSSPIIILTLASSLKNMTGMLGADVFVRNLMSGAADGLDNMLPAVIFLAACLLAFASGTSWGTFGILLPIVVAIFDPESTLLVIGISACLAGAVCGDHCSPISDTTIMASAGGQCDHMVHVSTQLPYAITTAAVSFVMFILAGLVQNAVFCLLTGILLMTVVLLIIRVAERE